MLYLGQNQKSDLYLIFFKVFIEFVTTLLLFYVLGFQLQGVWDLSFLTRDQICIPCIESQSLNHWTVREVLKHCIFNKIFTIKIISEEMIMLIPYDI